MIRGFLWSVLSVGREAVLRGAPEGAPHGTAAVVRENLRMTDTSRRAAALIDRRSFLGTLAGVAAAAGLPRQAQAAPAGTFTGIQMGPHTILDEGIERTLDLIAGTAAVNAVMPYSHAYNAGLVKPLSARADHGVPLADNARRRFPLVWVTRPSPRSTSTPAAICSRSLPGRRANAE